MTASLRDRARRGVLWSAAQTWIARACGALAFVVVGRQLDPADFGLVALAAAIIGMSSVVADSGLATYVIRAEEVDRDLLSTAFWTSLALSIVLAGGLLALASPLSAAYDEPGLRAVLRWLAVSVVFTGLAGVPSALLRRRLQFKQLAIRDSVAVLISSVVAVGLALAGAGVWALVAQTLTNGLVTTVVVWAAVRWTPARRWDIRLARPMLGFGVQVLGIDLLGQARSRGQDLMIGGVLGPVALGMWSVATRLLTLVLDTGTSVVNAVATPVFSRMQTDRQRLFRAYGRSLAAASAAVLPLLFVLAVLSPVLVPALLGDQWTSVSGVAQVLAFSAAVSSLSYFDRSLYIAVDRLRVELVLVAISVVSQLGVVLVFAHAGLIVLAVALLCRNVVFVPVRWFVLHRSTGLPYRAAVPALRVAVAAGLVAGAVHLTLRLFPAEAPPWGVLAGCALVAAVCHPLALLLCARPVAAELRAEFGRVVPRRHARTTGPDAVAPTATASSR